MSVQLLNAALTASFAPSQPLLIDAQAVTLFWKLVTFNDATPTVVEFYLEYTDADPTDDDTVWFAEVDEQDAGAGAVSMAAVIRTFNENALNTGLADGTHYFATPFSRRAQFVRVQVRATDGGGSVRITSPFGSIPQAPAAAA